MARAADHPFRRPGARGFTLLEVVVALIVFAVVFGVVTQIIQTGFRQSRAAAETTTAALLARSVLARVGPELPVAAGRYEGAAADGYRWLVEIEPAPAEVGTEPPLVHPYTVRVAVAWGADDGQQIELTTLRLAPAER